MKVKLKSTVTLIAEHEIDTDDYGCKVHEILDFDKAELTKNPSLLLDMPGCQTFAKVEEIQ